ncbi:hypothetical protein GGQ84_002139 [Desulfitispora alkaliphila]|uniref:small multi-drug export protein n=1 Tax=Desulfitispora alkaliphila TaxID=622674 RepID=UPI003D1DE829
MDSFWEYLIVFVLAATPWVELLLVVPIGIARGLNPVLVGVVAFLGNVIPVFLILLGFKKLEKWWKPSGKRSERAARFLNKYGLPGLAMVAPLLTGIHLATVIALALGAARQKTAYWMTLSLALWTIGLTAAVVLGIESYKFLLA